MKLSLRSRLILSFWAVIVVTVVLVMWLAYRITTNRFTDMVLRAGQARADRLAPVFADYYTQVGSWAGVGAFLENLETRRDSQSESALPRPAAGIDVENERLLLVDTKGRIVADSAGQNVGRRLVSVRGGLRLPAPYKRVYKGAPIVVGGQRVGTLVFVARLGTFTPNQIAFLRQVGQLMVAAGLLAGLVALLVGSFQARRILAPVQALAQAARRIAGGDLSQRIPLTSEDEMGEMATAFNTMVAKLEGQRELRHRAMADIAHELRTPLSVLQIDLESIEDGLAEPTPEAIARLREEVALLNHLVEDLRMLSLVEAGELQLDKRPVDVVEWIRATAGRVRNAAREKGVVLSISLPGQLPPVSGDEQRLSQVLLNLLSNALRHTPPEGQITVSARQVREGIQISLQDTGEGIPASELPHIFERFYRADRARSRGTGGSGLGLSIARSLVEAHGGRMWVESIEGQGSTFHFTLPRQDFNAH